MKIIEIARFVENVAATTQFYRTLLGIEPTYCDDCIATFQHEGTTLLIHQRYVPGPEDLPCEDHIAFGVADVDQAAAELTAQGLAIEFPARDYDWGRSAYLRDPTGALIEIASMGSDEQA